MNLGLYMQIFHDPGSHDPDPGPQEKSMKKSCVSFEAECRWHSNNFFVLWYSTKPRLVQNVDYRWTQVDLSEL